MESGYSLVAQGGYQDQTCHEMRVLELSLAQGGFQDQTCREMRVLELSLLAQHLQAHAQHVKAH